MLIAAVAGLALLACNPITDSIKGSGNLVTDSKAISDFSKIDATDSFQVRITQSPDYAVVIKADDNLVEYLDIRKAGDTLVVGLVSGKSARNATLMAEVALPHLIGVNLSGVSQAELHGITSQGSFAAELSGVSKLRGDLQARHTKVALSGASGVDLEGSGTVLALQGSGASTIDLEDFNVGSAEVALSGASTARLNVKDDIGPVTLSGASRLIYSGDPVIRDFETSGASSISARD